MSWNIAWWNELYSKRRCWVLWKKIWIWKIGMHNFHWYSLFPVVPGTEYIVKVDGWLSSILQHRANRLGGDLRTVLFYCFWKHSYSPVITVIGARGTFLVEWLYTAVGTTEFLIALVKGWAVEWEPRCLSRADLQRLVHQDRDSGSYLGVYCLETYTLHTAKCISINTADVPRSRNICSVLQVPKLS